MGAPSLDSLIAKIRASAAKDRNMAQALANASGTIVAASPQPPRYTPLSLTFVSYQQGDTIGKVAALVTLAPIFAHVALGSWILARRELHAACLFAGSVLNTALCVAIKSQVRQPRPAGATLQDYGMPSNHAQTTTFLALYCVLLLWHGCTVRHSPGSSLGVANPHPNPNPNSDPNPNPNQVRHALFLEARTHGRRRTTRAGRGSLTSVPGRAHFGAGGCGLARGRRGGGRMVPWP